MNEMPKPVSDVYEDYPKPVRDRFLQMRDWIFEEAAGGGVTRIDESLKWGEPSYGHRGGSPIRFGWKPAEPDTCRLLFHCQSRLIPTFRELYGRGPEKLIFEGQRAIVFSHTDSLPEAVVRHCIALALRYHRIKSLPMLGVRGPASSF